MERLNKHDLNEKFKAKRRKQYHEISEINQDNLPDRREPDRKWFHTWGKRRLFGCSCRMCRYDAKTRKDNKTRGPKNVEE
jgi:hypothetical protein